MDQFDKQAEEISIQSSSPRTPQSESAASTLAPAKELSPGEIINERYKVICLLGRGGIGSVYKVEQVFLGKQFALKTLNSTITSPAAIRRFQKEAQAASKLEHQYLVRAVDFGLIDNAYPFLVMDLIEGNTLAKYLKKKGRLSVEAAIEIFIPICFAMGYAHENGVIHRDIKPSNIVLTRPDGGNLVPKIVDFGIAKLNVEEESTTQALTSTGEVLGTPLYMSPEQCAAARVDSRSDIYSLGCVLYEALTGAPPFRGATVLETMIQHKSEPSKSLKEASLGVDFPLAIEKIVSKMLAKEPNERYQSCLEVAEDLSLLKRGEADRIKIKDTPPKRETVRGNVGVLPVLIATLITFLAIATVFWFKVHNNDTQAIQQPAPAKTDLTTALAPLHQAKAQEIVEGSFSQIKGDERHFSLPAISLGTLFWWDHMHTLQKRDASGKFSVPRDAKLIFEIGTAVARGDSMYLLGFNEDDLAAVMLKTRGQFQAGFLQPIFGYLEPLRLRSIHLKGQLITPITLSRIGHRSDLRWLVLLDCNLKGSQVAKLQNLKQLRVLSINDLDTATPILKQLTRGSPIRRLSLMHSNVQAQDIDLISRLHTITALNLKNNLKQEKIDAAARARICARLAKLPQLRMLCVDGRWSAPATVKECENFKHSRS